MNKTAIKMCLLLVLVIFLFSMSKRVYSTLYSEVSGESKIPLSSWNIKVNHQNITQIKDLTINDINWESAHTKTGKVAPGSIGTFQLIIDPSNTDVSVRYDLTYIDHTVDQNKLLTITKIESSTNSLIQTKVNTYTGIFTLNNIDKPETITITCEWVNQEENNDTDSLIGLAQVEPDPDKFISLQFKASQYEGETIESY